VDTARLEEMTRKSYRSGWRLLKATWVAEMRVNQITGDFAEQLKFPGIPEGLIKMVGRFPGFD